MLEFDAQRRARAAARIASLRNRVARLLGGGEVGVWHHASYRAPFGTMEHLTSFDPRRADLVMWALRDLRVVRAEQICEPPRISYRDLGRVHTPELLETLGTAEGLADIFAVDVREIRVDEVVSMIRRACGGTVAAARATLAGRGPQVNLLGGFHHASPTRGAGFSPVNDIAVAIASLRADGFEGRVAVIDLDAHPPDGTAGCLAADTHVWIGSISGVDWGALPGVDETVVPGAEDDAYLTVLDDLLARMPDVSLAFVLAGGDVVAGDRLGGLSLTEVGTARRDRAVRDALAGVPTVWLPGGGYRADAWRVLFQTASIASIGRPTPIASGYDPLRSRFARVARELSAREDEAWFSADDLADLVGSPAEHSYRLLGFYTAEWMEHALERYGILEHLRRLGYGPFRVAVGPHEHGGEMRLWGRAEGGEHLLCEAIYARTTEAGRDYLFVHWLTLRHPLAAFSDRRPRLPNQEVPGLGLARETGELLLRMAKRLHLSGVALRPAAFHIAFTARHEFRFVDTARQGRFLALVDVLEGMPLADATRAVSTGRLRLDGTPYTWEPDLMVSTVEVEPFGDADEVAAVRASARFELAPDDAPDVTSAS